MNSAAQRTCQGPEIIFLLSFLPSLNVLDLVVRLIIIIIIFIMAARWLLQALSIVSLQIYIKQQKR